MTPMNRPAALLLATLIAWLAHPPAQASGNVLYQVSTIHALMEGVYDGHQTLGELKGQGDFGLGTFDRLDGELILHEGEVYQVTHGGEVLRPEDGIRTPFATVHRFAPDTTLALDGPVESFAALQRLIDARLPSTNLVYGLRLRGRFDYVKTRSVPPADRPYPPLVEMAARQNTFEREGVEGVMVGYYVPAYMAQLNVPGYHLHFLSDDRRFGGHLLDCRMSGVNLEVDALSAIRVDLPESGAFLSKDFTRYSRDDLDRVELETGAGAPAAGGESGRAQ